MAWMPAASALVVQLATPAARVTDVQPPMGVPPSLKVTLPLPGPELPVTFAVKVTDWPVVVGSALEPSVVVEATTKAGSVSSSTQARSAHCGYGAGGVM